MRRLFVALLGAAAVYEIVTLTNQRAGDTISEIVWEATAHRPLVPFAIGCLCGHFFWQRVTSPAPADAALPLPSAPPLAPTRAGMHPPRPA